MSSWRDAILRNFVPHVSQLLAESSSAFIKTDETTVAHGGASIEEVIVPFVKFERRKTPSPCGRGSG